MKSTEQTRALATKVWDYIAEHPEQHDQTTWLAENECGTTMCVAGTTLFLSQGKGWYGGGNYSNLAGELLGLDSEEADDLFYNFHADDQNEDAIQKLKCIVVGESWLDKDEDNMS